MDIKKEYLRLCLALEEIEQDYIESKQPIVHQIEELRRLCPHLNSQFCYFNVPYTYSCQKCEDCGLKYWKNTQAEKKDI